jgi:hypothetical protein
MEFSAIAGAWLAAGLTLFLFSFLYKDNVFYKIGENLYVGITIGYMIVKLYYESWVPKVAEASNKWLVVVPVLIGILLLTRFVPKIAWLSRWSFAFIIGYGAGLAIPAVLTTSVIKQAEATAKPLITVPSAAEVEAAKVARQQANTAKAEKGADSPEAKAAETAAIAAERAGSYSISRAYADFTAIVLFLGVFSTLFYFFFSIEHKGPIKIFSRIGILFLMVYFGASYGFTVMGRLSLLYGRLLDLKYASGKEAWFATPILLAVMIGVLALLHKRGENAEESHT